MASTLATMRGRLRTTLMDWGARWPLGALKTPGVSAAATSAELMDARNFPSVGAASLERDVFSWGTKSGNILQTIPSSGVGALDSAHGTGAYVRLVCFSDSELGEMLNRAIAEFSRRRPYRTTASLTPTVNKRRIAMPTDALDVRRVYYLDTANGDAETDYYFDVDMSRREVVLDASFSDSSQSPLTADIVRQHDLYAAEASVSSVELIFEPVLLLLAEAEGYLNLAGEQARVATWSRGLVREDAPRSADALRELAKQRVERAESLMASPGLAIAAGSVVPSTPSDDVYDYASPIFRVTPL